MSLGYEITEDNRDFEQKGLTGTVTRYTTEGMEFPCYIVSSPFEKYKLEVLKSMFKSITVDDDIEDSLAVHLYFESNEKVVGFGRIYPKQVKSFLRLFEGNDIVGYYDKDTKLEGDYLYVLGG